MSTIDKSWIGTFTGRKFFPLAPRLEDICIEDIAHHLSIECRFTGATRTGYSVAQHSVLCSLLVPPQYALDALLHDATEAYLKDLPRPVKHDPAMSAYRDAEERLQRMIAERFALIHPLPAIVKAIDDIVCETERRDLMPETPPWTLGVKPLPYSIAPWPQAFAEQQFLSRFTAINAQRFAWLQTIGLVPRPPAAFAVSPAGADTLAV